MECGASLAEQEYYAAAAGGAAAAEAAPSDVVSTTTDVTAASSSPALSHPVSSSSRQSQQSSTSSAKTTAAADGASSTTTTTTTTKQQQSIQQSIEALRVSIAADVISSSAATHHQDKNNDAAPAVPPAMTTFTSPFEVPPDVSIDGRHNSNNNNVAVGRSMATPASQRQYLQLPLIYCDQTASNRPVRSIERYIEHVCLPLYGNTHTNTSITGSQSTAFVAEARQIVAEETNAKITGKASQDVVLFTGNGATSAVELLIDCLGLKHHTTAATTSPSSSSTEEQQHNAQHAQQLPVVFVGPYEHHSNLIPWRESGCEIVMVPESEETRDVDLVVLDRLLHDPAYANRIMKVGSFSAASNVTGKLSDVDAIAATLHRAGALAFFDYATASSYVSINMNPTPSVEKYPSASLVAKDAVFISPHKMIGGVGTPGVLIVKKQLVSQVNPPARSGGGTVFYVTHQHHRFLSNRVERYEGGTPNIPAILRVGLAFLLKRRAEQRYTALVNDSNAGRVVAPTMAKEENETGSAALSSLPRSIEEYDRATYENVASHLRTHAPNLVLLGGDEGGASAGGHLPIFSFLIRFGRRFLHFNYVCAILNDVFGIQSRGGCQCAGPYSQRLLGLTTTAVDGNVVPSKLNEDIENALLRYKERAELLRPGFTRISLPFKGLRSEEVDYVVKALVWVSKNAWALMPQYRCNHRTGEWRHSSRQGKPLGRTERKWLSHYDFATAIQPSMSPDVQSDSWQSLLDETFSNADKLLIAAKVDHPSIMQSLKTTDADTVLGMDEDQLGSLRWYVYPRECASLLSKGADQPEVGSFLGALNPMRVVKRIENDPASCNASLKVEHASCDGCDERPGVDRKRKPAVTINGTGRSPNEKLSAPIDDFAQLNFRDGSHSGGAAWAEIVAGVDDGELSDRCEVYVEGSGTWISVQSLQQRQTKSAPTGATTTATTPTPPTGKKAKKDAVKSLEGGHSVVDTANKTSLIKKAARDSSTWGHGSCLVRSGDGEVEADVGDDVTSSALPIDSGSTQTNTPAPPGPNGKKLRYRHVKPPPKLMRLVNQTTTQWDMIQDGDRLLLGLSGGKDSMSLLHCLLEFKRKQPIKFELEICTIDPMTPSFDPSPLIPYVESLGLTYHYVRDDIVSRASTAGPNGQMVKSLCAFCARMKRGNLYACARKNGCNKLVLAQHLDDCAESFMMSVMHNGFLGTMKANYKVNAGDLSVIRPLVYCRESLMTEFAKSANLPIINENCPACFEEPKERARVKKMLSREETLYPQFYDNIRHSLIPLMSDDCQALMRCYTEEAVSKSRRDNHKSYGKRKKYDMAGSDPTDATSSGGNTTSSTNAAADPDNPKVVEILRDVSEDDLLLELARRKAERYRLAGAMKRLDDEPVVCTANGCSI